MTNEVNHQQIRRLMDKARNATPQDDTPYGYIAFMGRRHISRMQDVLEAQDEGLHKSGWVEDVDGVEFTGCVCGVQVPQRFYDESWWPPRGAGSQAGEGDDV